MPVTPSRPPASSRRIGLRAIGLAALLVAQTTMAAAASAPPLATAAGAAAGLEPSIHWEQARAHENDRISFTPGARVTVGFTPRSTDRWTVGGVAPQRLPAGRLDGKAMRQQGAAKTPAAKTPAAKTGRSRSRYVCRAGGRAHDPGSLGRPADRRPRRRGRGRSRLVGVADRPGRDRAAGAGRPGRPPARGVRVPAVLAGELEHAAHPVRQDLDDRLLRRRRRRGRQPPEAQQQRHDDDRLERLDQREDDVDHQRRPFNRDEGRPDGPELRLELDREGAPEGPAQQLERAPEPGPPDRGGGARPRRRRRQPRLRAARRWRRGPVHGAGPHDPDRVEQGPQGLPDHVRHDRFHRQLPDRERHRPGWRRRHLHHGLRLPRARQAARSGAWHRCRGRATTSATPWRRTPPACRRRS